MTRSFTVVSQLWHRGAGCASTPSLLEQPLELSRPARRRPRPRAARVRAPSAAAVARDVGGAARPLLAARDQHHRHRRLGRDALDVAEPVAVEHHVARPPAPGACEASDRDRVHAASCPLRARSGSTRCPGRCTHRRLVEVAAVEDHRLSSASRLIASKSGLRNSFHSVTMTSASAPSSAADRRVGERHARRVAEDRAAPRASRPDRRRTTVAPRAEQRRRSTTRLGASRMSSVFGLNARPHSAKRRPAGRRRSARTIFSTSTRFCASLTASTASSTRSGCAALGGGALQRLHVLREARAAVAGAGIEEVVADARIGADALAHRARCRRRARSARLRELVHERDARGEHRVGRVLGELGRAHVHHQQPLVVALERRVELRASAAIARSSSAPMTMRSGRMKSSTAAPSFRNSGFETTANGDRRRRAARAPRRSPSRTLSAVPTGTVDLSTTTL